MVYLIGKSSTAILIAFLRRLSLSRFHLYALTEQDLEHAAIILEQYLDSRIDFVDATVMAVAERRNSQTIFTIDHRDFSIYRSRNVNYFTLLPTSHL